MLCLGGKKFKLTHYQNSITFRLYLESLLTGLISKYTDNKLMIKEAAYDDCNDSPV